jgi:hypothetical protein
MRGKMRTRRRLDIRASRRLSGIVATGFVLLLLAVPVQALAFPAPSNSTAPTGIIIPMFNFSPAKTSQILQEKQQYPSVPFTVVIDVKNGTGPVYLPKLATAIKQMRSAGITVLGYVPSLWGEGSVSVEEAQMRNWSRWYSPDGIYLDQMSNWEFSSTHVYLPTYYTLLTRYAKSIGFSEVLGNSGADVPYYFVGSVDSIGIYENHGAPSLTALNGTLVTAGWHMGYDKRNFWFVAYNLTSFNQYYLLDASNYVSYLYLTNGTRPSQYDSLSPMLDQIVSKLAEMVPVTVQSSTMLGSPAVKAFKVIVTQPDGSKTACFTPCTFDVYSGSAVNVTLQNERGYSFAKWGDNSTSTSRVVSVTSPTSFTAYTSNLSPSRVPAEVISTATNGIPITGLFTRASFPNGTIAAKGYTPLTFQALPGVSYSINVSNYHGIRFDHWAGGAKDDPLQAQPNQTIVVNAVFSPSVRAVNLTEIRPNQLSIPNSSAVAPPDLSQNASGSPAGLLLGYAGVIVVGAFLVSLGFAVLIRKRERQRRELTARA